ncbi:MAG: STAS domain-containing protein [Candidatus Eisenbacteria bacterium]|uniref:Anti-sigma factor antagonist n=1 Tax=Eiseniibacteriota bacterium TaxID=2212470 RepID=A0A538T584_UNCEI|nr:MAG: STAS domain-containing protein [Candidatus Eisenbacteria bacterium]
MKGIDVYVEEAPQNRGVSILRVSGYVDTTTSPDLERRLQALLREKRFHVVVDLAKVEYISSAGWGIFISEIREIREHGGDLKLAGMAPDVREVFDLLEFENILQSYSDTDLAVASFGPIVPANLSMSPNAAGTAAPRQPGEAHAPQRSETVLSDDDLVREIVRQHPDYGLMRIQKELRRPERGGRELNPVQLYVLLRKLELDTRERREALAKRDAPATSSSPTRR